MLFVFSDFVILFFFIKKYYFFESSRDVPTITQDKLTFFYIRYHFTVAAWRSRADAWTPMDKQYTCTLTPKLMNGYLSKYCIVSVLSLRLTLSLYPYHILSTNFYFPKIVSFFFKTINVLWLSQRSMSDKHTTLTFLHPCYVYHILFNVVTFTQA